MRTCDKCGVKESEQTKDDKLEHVVVEVRVTSNVVGRGRAELCPDCIDHLLSSVDGVKMQKTDTGSYHTNPKPPEKPTTSPVT